MIEKAAIGNAKQPALDILDVRDFVSHPEGLEKGFLRQLISEGTVPTKSAQKGSDRALMGANDQRECVDLRQVNPRLDGKL